MILLSGCDILSSGCDLSGEFVRFQGLVCVDKPDYGPFTELYFEDHPTVAVWTYSDPNEFISQLDYEGVEVTPGPYPQVITVSGTGVLSWGSFLIEVEGDGIGIDGSRLNERQGVFLDSDGSVIAGPEPPFEGQYCYKSVRGLIDRGVWILEIFLGELESPTQIFLSTPRVLLWTYEDPNDVLAELEAEGIEVDLPTPEQPIWMHGTGQLRWNLTIVRVESDGVEINGRWIDTENVATIFIDSTGCTKLNVIWPTFGSML